MIDERFEEFASDQKLTRLVRKFSVLEGRQPRAMVCRSLESIADGKIKEVSVELAGFGFDVDIGIPFDSIDTLGMNAIENDVDVLVLFVLQDEKGVAFIDRLESYLSDAGYSDLLILHEHQDFSPGHFRDELIRWLENTLV